MINDLYVVKNDVDIIDRISSTNALSWVKLYKEIYMLQ